MMIEISNRAASTAVDMMSGSEMFDRVLVKSSTVVIPKVLSVVGPLDVPVVYCTFKTV